jgi:ribosomal protein L11 methyltransferase
MFSLVIECDPEDREILIAELWERGSAGIVELDATRLRAFFENDSDRFSLEKLYPGSPLRIEADRDWIERARQMLPPLEVGERFFLVPEWRDDPAPAGRFRIVVNPGMAFGTGAHETTQLCLEALEQFVRPGDAVLDVGTGSGILAEAAALLGGKPIYACDNDPQAVEIAAHRAAGAGFFVGSADAAATACANIAVANISPEIVIRLVPEFRRVLRPGGILLVSGFETGEIDQVKAALPPVQDVRQKGNWALIVAQLSA